MHVITWYHMINTTKDVFCFSYPHLPRTDKISSEAASTLSLYYLQFTCSTSHKLQQTYSKRGQNFATATVVSLVYLSFFTCDRICIFACVYLLFWEGWGWWDGWGGGGMQWPSTMFKVGEWVWKKLHFPFSLWVNSIYFCLKYQPHQSV